MKLCTDDLGAVCKVGVNQLFQIEQILAVILSYKVCVEGNDLGEGEVWNSE